MCVSSAVLCFLSWGGTENHGCCAAESLSCLNVLIICWVLRKRAKLHVLFFFFFSSWVEVSTFQWLTDGFEPYFNSLICPLVLLGVLPKKSSLLLGPTKSTSLVQAGPGFCFHQSWFSLELSDQHYITAGWRLLHWSWYLFPKCVKCFCFKGIVQHICFLTVSFIYNPVQQKCARVKELA